MHGVCSDMCTRSLWHIQLLSTRSLWLLSKETSLFYTGRFCQIAEIVAFSWRYFSRLDVCVCVNFHGIKLLQTSSKVSSLENLDQVLAEQTKTS